MRNFFCAALLALMAVGTAFTVKLKDTYKVDVKKSKIGWVGHNVAGGKHTGELKLSSGALLFDAKELTGGTFDVDMNSLTVTDLQGDRATRLAGHLKNEDFFDAPKFPKALFRITKVNKAAAKDQVTITGDLTIRGITKAVSFPATIHQMGSSIHATASGVKINRTLFDVKYRSGSFFSDLGDKAIADEMELNIEIVAAK